MCFECSVRLSKARMWQGLADAAVRITPLIVQALANGGARSVRRFARRHPANINPPTADELRELRRIAGLSDPSERPERNKRDELTDLE
jgi:hypothetical protein